MKDVNYWAGVRFGVWLFAWWKDGIQYVGNCGETLKEALEYIDKEEKDEEAGG